MRLGKTFVGTDGKTYFESDPAGEPVPVLSQREGNMALAYRTAVQRQKDLVQHHKYQAMQEQSVLDAMERNLEAFVQGYLWYL